jgi:dynein heavy chain, axonemal
MQRISQTIKILKYYRTIFDEYKESLAQFFGDRPVVQWTFHPNAVFERFDAFLDRLHTIQWFFYTVIEFLKLEKVEIGGLKGRILSGRITAVSLEFNQCFSSFASKSYDVLDPDDESFKEDFEKFQDRILELDMKLAAILCQAFDDSHNLESVFKLISIVGTVLERPKIKEEFTYKYQAILNMLDDEITTCELIYFKQIQFYRANGHLNVELRSPPVSSAIRWVNQLSCRITTPIKSFQALQHPIVDTEDAQMLMIRYNNLMERLRRFEKEIFEKWTETVPQIIEENLKKTLLYQPEESKVVILNFDPQLSAILREVHYLRLMNKEDVPEKGISFSEEQEMFRSYILNLEKSIEWYNTVSLKRIFLIIKYLRLTL